MRRIFFVLELMGGKDTLHYKESVEENGSKILKKPKDLMPLDNHKETPNESIYLTLRVLPDIGCPCDNTNANRGCEGELVTLLEKKNLHTMGCSLHQMNFHLELYSNIYMHYKKPHYIQCPWVIMCK